MKAYVFIVMSICEIGGSEQYIYNKSHYLKKNGYDVYVFSGMTRQIMIEELKEYEKYIIPSIMYSPCFYRKREVNLTITQIIEELSRNEYESITIESDGIDEAKWGEMLANRLKAKHILFNVQETHNYTNEEINFLRFKLNRNELFGINVSSVGYMLGENKEFPEAVFTAYCNNVVKNCADRFSNQLNLNATLTLASIGRLEKPCVIPIIDEFVKYIKENPFDTFNILLVGGTDESNVIRRIESKLENLDNATLVITGSLYPIPRTLLHRADVFVSTAGSASVSYMEEIPTIKVHPVSGLPCGVIGESFDHFKGNMYETMDGVTISSLIEDIIKKRRIPEFIPNLLTNYEKRMNCEFQRQISITEERNTQDYYDITQMDYKINGIKKIFYYLMGKTLGGVKMQAILERLRSIIK